MAYEKIRTDTFLNEKVWSEMSALYGENYNKLLKNNPINKVSSEHSYSQNNEDLVLDGILQKIGLGTRISVEFGAMDGIKISTTLLFKNKYNFKRILIEGNPKYKNNTCGEEIIKSIITPDNINLLLDNAKCPNIFDILSIDIDGDDYWVWKAMTKKARIVYIEYHSAIPNNIPLAIIPNKGTVQSHLSHAPRLNGYYGSNLSALYRLAITKGYKFVTTILDNAIFVLAEEFPKLDIAEISEEECIKKYFLASKYWWDHRDKNNLEWLIVE
jgi:hypothetical protein